MRAGIVGARRKVLGTGPFVARGLAAAGCPVTSIVGSSPETVARACVELEGELGVRPRGYLSLAELLAAEHPDLIAICSPSELHRGHLEDCLKAGVHVLCEKPLWWGEEVLGPLAPLAASLTRIVGGFRDRGRVLQLNTQWPCVLPSFAALFPEHRRAPLRELELRLSPIGRGLVMVVDSAPHLLSLLQAILGAGSLADITARWKGEEEMILDFEYCHPSGQTHARLLLKRVPEQPRPAWLTLNGQRASREIESPAYTMSLHAESRSVPLPDPLMTHLNNFISAVQRGAPTEVDLLSASLLQLRELVQVAATRLPT